jgi:dienelactone hydrolase
VIITEEIDYKDGDTPCRGFLAYDSNWTKPMPTVMIAHDWTGRGPAACDKARQLALLGYVAFAIDMFGEAQLGHDNEQRKALITPLLENRLALVTRMRAAFDLMHQIPQVDCKKIAAIGYCFGGLCVLDLARAGVNLRGAVSFHGLLSAPSDATFDSFPSKILILHGFDDPLVPPEQVLQFEHEMTTRKVDWQLHAYGLTSHSFTNPDANDPEMGLRYNERAAHRSWQSMELFLTEVFR